MYCTWAILLFDTLEYLSLCWAVQPPSMSRSDFDTFRATTALKRKFLAEWSVQ